MNAIQLISGPFYTLQPRLDLPYISQNRRYLFTFNIAKFSICCNKSAASLSTPTLERANVTQLLIDKYGLTEENIAKVFQQCNNIADSTSTLNVEHSLRLLQAEGLTSAQIRKAVNYNPRVFRLDPNNNIKVKLNFLKTFVKQKDLIKLVSVNPRLFNLSIESGLKPAISFLQTLGYEGEALSALLGSVPGMLTSSEETILRLITQAEAFGHTKGSPMFAVALNSIGRLKEDILDQKMQHFYSLGFSEQQVLFLCKRMPQILTVSKEKVTRNLDFLVNSAGLSLNDVAKRPILLTYSLKARLIPRYRVFEALKSMDVLKNLPSFPTVVKMTEDCFLDRYILPYAKSHLFCDKSAASLSTPTLERADVTQLLIEKYGLTEESIAKAFQLCNNVADSTATCNVEHSLRLLQAEGLTYAQIRKVVNYNPRVFLLDPDKNIKVKLNFLKTFMKQKDLIKLVSVNPRLFNYSIENRLKPAISFLQTLGYEGEALSELLGSVSGMVTFSEETILRLIKQAEAFGHTKGSPMFAVTLNCIGRLKEDLLEQKMQHLYSLGFSEQQVLFLCKRMPQILAISKEKIMRNLDFLVNSAGLSLSDVAKQPSLLTYSLKARLIPRYRVFEALKSMDVVENLPSFPTYRVFEALKSMDVVENLPSFPTVVKMTECCFLDRCILPYAKSSSLQNIYTS